MSSFSSQEAYKPLKFGNPPIKKVSSKSMKIDRHRNVLEIKIPSPHKEAKQEAQKLLPAKRRDSIKA